MKILHLAVAAVAAASSLLFVGAGSASAATTSVSTQAAPAGWSVANRPGGAGDRANPVYSDEQARSGRGSLKFSTPAEADQVATYHAASGKLSAVTSASFDWFKVNTPVSGGSAGQSVSFVLFLDVDGSGPSTALAAMQWEPVYQPGIDHPANVLPTGAWQHSNLLATGTNCWGDTGECHTFQEFATTTYPNATLVAYGFNQGTSNPTVVSYADNAELNGNIVNFEVPVISVAQQGVASKTWFHGGNPALGGLTVKAWVDIEKTCVLTNCTYRVRGADEVFKTGSTLRVQSDALRLGSPNRGGVFAADGARNSGEAASVTSVTPWVNVRAATLCSNPIQLWSGVSASARWADTTASTVSFRSNPTNSTSKVCLP